MNNRYLFLTHGIDSIGGGQLYVASKMEYLKSLGWDVEVFAFADGDIMLPSLKQFKRNIISELINHPLCYGRSVRNSILRRLSEGCDENTVIETNSMMLALWGELLAEKLNCKHLFYNINETTKCPKQLFDFYRFKLYRNEFKGITDSSISYFFSGILDIKPSKDFYLGAIYDIEQVEDYSYDLDALFDPNLITIGVVGRLDKPFILEVTKKLMCYFKNKTMRFNLIYIGGAGTGSNIEYILRKELSVLDNINLIFAGYLFPMPRNLVRSLDVCISSSGAVRSVTKEKILTIAIDANDFNPIGILGVTTDNTLFRKEEKSESLGDILDDVLLKNKYSADDIKYIEIDQDASEKWMPHIEFISKASPIKDYYVNFQKPSILKTLLIRTLGISFYKKLYSKLK